MGVKTIVTHWEPHPDEAAAVAILAMYGKDRLALDSDCEIIFVDAGYEDYQRRNASELEADGIIQIGVGSGRFNEHAKLGEARQKGQTAATLVARALKVDRRPEVKYLLDYISANDLKGEGSKFDLAHLMRIGYQAGDTCETVLRAAVKNCRQILQTQSLETAIPEIEKGKRRQLSLPGNRKVLIISIRSDSRQLLQSARFLYRNEPVILVVEKPTGQVQVLPSRNDLKSEMAVVAAFIRFFEAEKAGMKIDAADPRLYQEAAIPGMPSWHFQVETGMVFNGANTAPGKAPTRMDLASVVMLVEAGLQRAFKTNAA